MSLPSTVRDLSPETELRLVVTLTAVFASVHGVVLALTFALREKNAQALGLSGAETVLYVLGPFLVEPVVLFVVIYYVGSHCDRLPSLPGLVPWLIGAVVVGSVSGQFAGEALFVTGWTPVAKADLASLPILDSRVLPYWRDLAEPPVRALLTALAALALARS